MNRDLFDENEIMSQDELEAEYRPVEAEAADERARERRDLEAELRRADLESAAYGELPPFD